MQTMTTSGKERSGNGLRPWKIGTGLAVYLIGVAAFAAFAVARCRTEGLLAVLLFTESALVAGGVVLIAAAVDPRGVGVRGFVVTVSAVSLLMLAATGPALLIVLTNGAGPLGGALLAQLLILTFCLLLASVFALVRCVGAELFSAQLVCILVACALMGTVFYVDPLVEADQSPETRSVVITAALAANPMTAMSWSLLRYDLMHGQIMYDRVSVIGRWHRIPDIQWWQTACGYAAGSVLFFLGAAECRRRRLSRLVNAGGS